MMGWDTEFLRGLFLISIVTGCEGVCEEGSMVSLGSVFLVRLLSVVLILGVCVSLISAMAGEVVPDV